MIRMKDSGITWCGQIPENWAIMPNKYVMFKKKEICAKYNGQDILSLTMDGVIVRDLAAGGKMPATFDGYQIVYPDNLLMCLFDYDVTPRCIGLIKNEGLTSPAYSQFVIKNGNSPKYYYYYYLMIDNTKELLHLAKNLRHSFTEDQLGVINTPVPPIKTQNKIADFLDEKCNEIDLLHKTIEKQIETLEEYKKSVITEAVTKGLNADVKMKDSGIELVGLVPNHWTILKTGYLFKENVRKALEDDIPLSLSQVDGLIATDKMKESSLKTASYDGWKHVVEDDLVLNRFKAHLGVMFASTIQGMVSFHYGVFEKQRPLVTKYYEYLFHTNAYKTIYAGLSNGMTVGLQNLSNQNFYTAKCLYPSYDEQKEIVDYLDRKCNEINGAIIEKSEQLEILEQYKKSLIYEYVTGKKEVPNNE